MRATLLLLLWLSAMACCCAQQSPDSDKRLTALMNKDPSTDPRRNPYPNAMSHKKFEGGGDLKISSATEQSSTFSGAKKFDSRTFETRSFFGIKNPWFGKKVYDTKSADLSKSTLANADKKFATKDAGTKEFAQSGKEAPLPDNHAVKTNSFVTKGAAQGGVDQLKKNLTIDDVREILNKNH